MGFWEEDYRSKVHFYTFPLFKNTVSIPPPYSLPSMPQSCYYIDTAWRIKEMKLCSSVYYRKSFLPKWILLAMDSLEKPPWRSGLRATDQRLSWAFDSERDEGTAKGKKPPLWKTEKFWEKTLPEGFYNPL